MAHALDTNTKARFFSPAQSNYLLDFYGYACAACGCDDSAILEIDHWIPFNGSNTVIDNGVVLCRACNGAKHDLRINAQRLAPRKPIDTDSHRVYRVRESANRAAFAEWAKTYGVKPKDKIEKKRTKFLPPY